MTKDQFLLSHGWKIFSNGAGHMFPITYHKDGKDFFYINDAVQDEGGYKESDIFDESTFVQWKAPKEFGICLQCGSQNYKSYTSMFLYFAPKDTEKTNCVTECGDCKNIKPTQYYDAAGNAVSYSEELTGKYSYAFDTVLHSKKHLADHMKRHDLVQRGNDRPNDPRFKDPRYKGGR